MTRGLGGRCQSPRALLASAAQAEHHAIRGSDHGSSARRRHHRWGRRRLGGRRTCAKNGHIFHVDFDPPKNEGVCDVCGARLIVRDDDKPDVIRHRLDTYHEKTSPLVDFYEERGVLKRVDGELDPDEVGNRIRALLATLRLEEEL